MKTLLAVVLALTLATAAFAQNPQPGRQGRPLNTDWLAQFESIPAEDAICFCLYTVHNGVLKLTAQLYPLADGVDRAVTLQVRAGENWKDIATTNVSEEPYGDPQADVKRWTAHFLVQGWDHARDHAYRVVAAGGKAAYTGTIRRDPADKETIVVAAFTGNGNNDRRLKPDIVANIKHQDPDLLFFSGDQVYDHFHHYQAWLLFGRQFGEITRDRPTICIPDDHDVGQANIWGESGVASTRNAGDDGGFTRSPQYVNSVQNAQTWHLPDAFDPTPVQQNIGVYYTSLRVGRVGFAIIEDRKFKTGPDGVIPKMGPRPDHINDPKYDRQAVDLPDAVLLGDRQHKFLREWGQDWLGTDMKCVLSQTIFANAAHRHGRFPYRLLADLDSNGWPQRGRNAALQEIRRSYSFMIGGDQHLATVVHHGINHFGDSGYSFCVPSIVNFYNRWWDPLPEDAVRKIDGPLPHLGDFYDGFGNKLTMHAYANPDETREKKYGGEWGGKADGYGIVRFNTDTRRIVMECWPRGVDVSKGDAEQYAGWPVEIAQLDNYGRAATAYLPTITVKGMSDPVIRIVDEVYGELVYSVRIKGDSFRPKVFRDGKYTVHIGEPPERVKTLTGVVAKADNDAKIIVDLDAPR